MRHISEGSDTERWYFPEFLCMCMHTRMLPTHTFTSLIHPLGLIYTLSTLILVFFSASLHSLSLILHSSLSTFPYLPCRTLTSFISLFVSYIRLSFSLSVPLSLLPVSVCPPHLLFSPHLLPLSAQTGTRGKEMVTPCYRTHSIRLQKYPRKRLLFLCIQYMSILRANMHVCLCVLVCGSSCSWAAGLYKHIL